MTKDAVIPIKGSTKAVGHDLFSIEEVVIPSRGQATIGTGIAIGLPEGTYGRIAPRSRLAVKHGINIGAGVIDADYTGELKVLLLNQGATDYQVKKEDRIAQLIVEKINPSSLKEVVTLRDTD